MKVTLHARHFCSLILVVGLLLVPTRARAAVITIDDLTDTITVTWANFEHGFSVNGGPMSTDGSVTIPEPTYGLNFFGGWTTTVGVPNVPGGGSLGIIEPGFNTVDSDSLFVETLFEFLNVQCPIGGPGCASIRGMFLSDVAGIQLGITSPAIPESGRLDDVTSSFPGLPGDLTINVRSEFDDAGNDPGAVPEPSSIALLISGLLVGIRRRRRV